MAKREQLNFWLKIVSWSILAIFAAGSLFNRVDSQGADIKENRGDIKEVKENVHSIQRGQDKLSTNIESIKDDVKEAKEHDVLKRNEDREYQKEQRAINVQILTELAKWEAIKDGTH